MVTCSNLLNIITCQNDESRSKVITDVAFGEGLDDIIDPSFFIEERGYVYAPPVGKWMKVKKMNLVNGILIAGKDTTQ